MLEKSEKTLQVQKTEKQITSEYISLFPLLSFQITFVNTPNEIRSKNSSNKRRFKFYCVSEKYFTDIKVFFKKLKIAEKNARKYPTSFQTSY